MKKRSALLSLALVACLPFVTAAHAQEGSPKDHQKDHAKSDQSSRSSQKVEGIVAGVTVVGETMVDYETNRAAVAQVTYLTVVGRPSGQSAENGSKSADKDAAKAKDPSKGDEKDPSQKTASEGGSRPRANVYVLAISPDTEVCECKGDDKKSCDLSRLELGDHVQVEFMGSGRQPEKATASKHGRGRTYMGKARAISILADEHEDAGKNHKSGSSDSSHDKSAEGDSSKTSDDHKTSDKKDGDK